MMSISVLSEADAKPPCFLHKQSDSRRLLAAKEVLFELHPIEDREIYVFGLRSIWDASTSPVMAACQLELRASSMPPFRTELRSTP